MGQMEMGLFKVAIAVKEQIQIKRAILPTLRLRIATASVTRLYCQKKMQQVLRRKRTFHQSHGIEKFPLGNHAQGCSQPGRRQGYRPQARCSGKFLPGGQKSCLPFAQIRAQTYACQRKRPACGKLRRRAVWTGLQTFSPRTSNMVYIPFFLPASQAAARAAPRAKLSRLEALWVSSRRSPVPAK